MFICFVLFFVVVFAVVAVIIIFYVVVILWVLIYLFIFLSKKMLTVISYFVTTKQPTIELGIGPRVRFSTGSKPARACSKNRRNTSRALQQPFVLFLD